MYRIVRGVSTIYLNTLRILALYTYWSTHLDSGNFRQRKIASVA